MAQLGLPFDGERLKRFRELRGLYQAELAERCGVTQGYLSLLETGDRRPSPPLLKALTEALDVTVSDLLKSEPANAE